jgi:hypothetical protein
MHARKAVELSDRHDDADVAAHALAARVYMEFTAGTRMPLDLIERALATERAAKRVRIDRSPRLVYAFALSTTGDFAAARPLLAELRRLALDRGDESHLSVVLGMMTSLETHAGAGRMRPRLLARASSSPNTRASTGTRPSTRQRSSTPIRAGWRTPSEPLERFSLVRRELDESEHRVGSKHAGGDRRSSPLAGPRRAAAMKARHGRRRPTATTGHRRSISRRRFIGPLRAPIQPTREAIPGSSRVR